jgi:MoxR-like ATPase
MERMALLIHYILNGIPVLFEGNTGTSKTRTTLTACNYIKKFINKEKNNSRELIRYNLSAETKIDDIIAKYVSDQKSFIGLIVQNGPYVDAYVNGKIILFDEINLAPANVLQCIQQSLDNGFLSVETNGRCLLKYDKNPNFALVATQNPNKGAFTGKRQELGPEFLSRFQKIYFPDILKDEMQEIALGIAKNIGYLTSERDNKKKQLLKDIVNLHYEWAKETESQTDIQCFTIREIESVIQCLYKGELPYEVIMTIYGGRFRLAKKGQLEKKLTKIESFKNLKHVINSLPKNFPKCFENDALIQTVNGVLLSLRNKRNVIIVGNDESGLTQIAEWCSFYFNKYITKKNNDETFICFCTKNLECSDLIGTQKISDSNDENNELIRFEPRFLYNAIIEGNCVVLDSINEAPSRVIERLNGLLDKKISKEEEVFEVPENTKKPLIDINENFRIICTSNFEKINQISPAFVNRFEVIVLEDQLKNISESKIKNLIRLLCNKYQRECYDNYKLRTEKMKKNKTKQNKASDDPFDYLNTEEKKRKNNIKFDKTIEISDELMKNIFEKVLILSKGKNPNERTNDDSTTSSSTIDKEVDENSKKYLTMSSITKFCRTVVILLNKFKSQEKITKSQL